jgi:HEPN domain-containing protein
MISAERACAPWIENPYRLVSLKEILLMPRIIDAEGYPLDEVIFGRFFNLVYLIGILERPPLTEKNLIGMEVMVDLAAQDMERWGFFVTARVTRDLAKTLRGESIVNDLKTETTLIRQSLMTELETRVFVPIAPQNARYYREPTKDWEEVIARFGDTMSDIEESARCFALGRYAASVFHSTQVVELGLIELGKFLAIKDPKSGFTAVCNELRRILDKKYGELTDFERTNRPFCEQVYGTAEALKNAWRNKIGHAQGRLYVMTADFSPQIAEEIIYATRAFMRRLATELPSG